MQGIAASNTASDAQGPPFQVRGSLQTMLCLRLIRPADPAFFELLVAKIAHNPEFFRDAPVLLDVGPVQALPADGLGELIERLRQNQLAPIGIQNGSEAWIAEARQLGLALFASGGDARQPPPQRRQPEAAAKAVEPAAPSRTVVVTQPVRGGQQIISQGDVVVLAAVSPGAEIAARGNIHVYGALRGRAFAGFDGDEEAMIFCDQMNAELVSIAGIHLVNEEIDGRLLGKRTRVSCDGQQLKLAPLP